MDEINISPEMVKKAILDYYDEQKKFNLSVNEELSILNGNPNLRYYLIEHLEDTKFKKDLKSMLTEDDLRRVLSHYADSFNYDLEDYKYIGGIHRVGYYFSEDTPHYDGIKLFVKEKNNEFKLTKKQ